MDGYTETQGQGEGSALLVLAEVAKGPLWK